MSSSRDDKHNSSKHNGTDTDPVEGGGASETGRGTGDATRTSSPPDDAAASSRTAAADVDDDNVDVDAILAEGGEESSTTQARAGVPRVMTDEKAGTTKTTPAAAASERETNDAVVVPPLEHLDESDADAYGYLRYRFAECMTRCGAKGGGIALLNMRPKRDVAVRILSNELVYKLLRDDRQRGRSEDNDKGGDGKDDDEEGEGEGGRRGRHLKLIRDLLIERGATIARPVGADASFDTVGALAEDLVDLASSVDEQKGRAAMVAAEEKNKSGDSTAAAVEAKDDDAKDEAATSREEGAGGTSEEGKGKEKTGVSSTKETGTTVCRVEGCEDATVLGKRGFLCSVHLASNRPTEPTPGERPEKTPPQAKAQAEECSVEWCHGKARRRHRGMCLRHGREFLRSSSQKKKKKEKESSKKSGGGPSAAAVEAAGTSKRPSRSQPKKAQSKSKSKSQSSAKGSAGKKKVTAVVATARPRATTGAAGKMKPSAKSIANMERERRTKEACERFGVKYVEPPKPRGGYGETDSHRRVRIDTMISACHAAWEAEKAKKADEAERLRRKDETRELFTAAAAEAEKAQTRLDGDKGVAGAADDDDSSKPKKRRAPRVRDPSLPPAKKVVDPFTLKTRYICGVEGCVRYSVRDGVCISHGAHRKTECKIPGCTRYMVSQGVCIGHGAKRKTTCKVEGCTKYRVSNGVCIAHGGRRKTECKVPGCTKYMVSKGVCIAHGGKRKTECKVEGCTKYRVSNGVCISHGGKRKLLCTMEGCSRVRVSDSMCAKHSGGKSRAPPTKKNPKDASAGITASTTKTGKAHVELGSSAPTDAKVDMIEMSDELNV